MDAVVSVGQIRCLHTVFVDSVNGHIGSESTVEMKSLVCAVSSGAIRLDSWEELLEQFESEVDCATSIAAEVNDKLLLLLPHCIDEEVPHKCLRDDKPINGWIFRLGVGAGGLEAWQCEYSYIFVVATVQVISRYLFGRLDKNWLRIPKKACGSCARNRRASRSWSRRRA